MDTVTFPADPLAADPDLASFFLTRLEQLLAHQAAAVTAEGRVARGFAAFSVFLDCLDLGLETAARQVVDRTCPQAA